MRKEKLILLLLIINVILLTIIYNLILKNEIVESKQIIKEMSQSTLEADLNAQITALNAEHTEYMQNIQNCKTQIASAITDKGVETSDQETFEKMADNIRNISTNVSSNKLEYIGGTGGPEQTLGDIPIEEDGTYFIIAIMQIQPGYPESQRYVPVITGGTLGEVLYYGKLAKTNQVYTTYDSYIVDIAAGGNVTSSSKYVRCEVYKFL